MFKKGFIIIFIVFLVTVFGACQKPVNNELNFFTTMGETPVFLTFENQETLNKHYRPIKNIFDTYSELTDNFAPLPSDSSYLENIYSINEKIASLTTDEITIEIDYQLYQILVFAKSIEELTDGYFNISIGLLIDLWKDLIAKYQDDVIPQNVIDSTISKANLIEVKRNAFILSTSNNKYYITAQAGIKLDLGALAKGYALNLTRIYLEENNVRQYLINAGESSIALGINPKRENDVYYIGLSNPIYNRDQSKDISDPVNQLYYAYYYLKNLCITTSGNARQYALGADGNRYHHIISPITKKPENYYHSLTLINIDSGYADAITTALFSMPNDVLSAFISSNISDEVIVFNTNQIITKYNVTHQFKAVDAFNVIEVS